ncbi:hypothetical protein M8J77_020646 [Diaphorina citri]|nr:hypothetical protein M8J77_020646 [Diaphorina citri]
MSLKTWIAHVAGDERNCIHSKDPKSVALFTNLSGVVVDFGSGEWWFESKSVQPKLLNSLIDFAKVRIC